MSKQGLIWKKTTIITWTTLTIWLMVHEPCQWNPLVSSEVTVERLLRHQVTPEIVILLLLNCVMQEEDVLSIQLASVACLDLLL